MAVTREQILSVLASVPYPGFSRDVIASGVVGEVVIDGERVLLHLRGDASPETERQLVDSIKAAVLRIDGVSVVDVRIGSAGRQGAASLGMAGGPASTARAGAVDAGLVPGVRHVVAVASGKGGVGKSTVSVNLAVALSRLGFAVGLLDADIYGPSIPLMMGADKQRPQLQGNRLQPFVSPTGVRFMSLGSLMPADQAAIWRGPLVMKAVEQLLRDVDWGELDLLVVDLPPGTGDVQLTLSQRVRLSGAVVVTTPQDVALLDVVKAISMFRKMQVPLLGLIENMAGFECPHCGKETDIFGRGGGRAHAERLEIPFLGELPLDPSVRESGDSGTPFAADDEAPLSGRLQRIAVAVTTALELSPRPDDAKSPGDSIFERFKNALGDKTD